MGEQFLLGMGDMYIKIVVEKFVVFGVGVDMVFLQIFYCEIIYVRVEGQGKYKKQLGGYGQYGDCIICIEFGEGYNFCSVVVGGVVFVKYLLSIEKGIQDVL